jgi:predicted transcriptional regulator
MCKILLSIKPEYVERIFNNTKRYEYRRILAKNDVDLIIIYSSHPVKKIVGEFKVKTIIIKPPAALWKMTSHSAGISKNKFYEYFSGKSMAYAYEIKSVKKYKKHKNLNDFGIFSPPQSFVYV